MRNTAALLLALLYFSWIALAQGTNFQAPQRFAAASDPRQGLLADLNHDAKLDAIVLSHSGTVSVFLNNGTAGYFATPKTFTTISNPIAIAVADFNHDSKPDLVVISATAIQIYLGKGDGTFTTGGSYTTLSGTNETVVAVDVNKDSLPDLIVGTSTEIDFLKGNGDGTFATAKTAVSTGVNPGSTLAVADVNRDGAPDILAETGGNLGVALGNGDGTFQAIQTTTLSGTLVGLTVADFNHDGKLDIVAAGNAKQSNGSTAGVLNVLLGNGDGTFDVAHSYTYPAQQIASIVSGDFDKDGRLDLLFTVATNSAYNPEALMLFGNGDGSFENLLPVATSNLPTAIAVGDLDRDGWLDFVVVEDPANDIALFRNNVLAPTVLAQNFPAAIPLSNIGQYSNYAPVAATGDFNGDGNLDFAITGSGLGLNGFAEILFGDGKGNFTAGPLIQDAGWQGDTVFVGDFNNDGKLDLAVTVGSGLFILLGNGDGTFQKAKSLPVSFKDGVTPPTAIGDFNHDGNLDVALADSSSIYIFYGKGDGSFSSGPTYSVGGTDEDVRNLLAADFNRDGNLDLAYILISTPSDGPVTTSLQVLLGNADGTFNTSATSYSISSWGTGPSGSQLAAVDLSRDGNLDLIIPDEAFGMIIYIGNGDGTFQETPEGYVLGYPPSYTLGPTNASLADINGDGKLDLCTSNYYTAVLLGNGDGTFQPQDFYYQEALWSLLGDFRGIGYPDLLNNRQLTFNGGITRQIITSSLNPASPSKTVLLTARVVIPVGAGTPTGSVTFLDGITSLGTVTLDGTGSASINETFAVGSHRISTQYSGDSKYYPRTASTLTEVVENNPTTTVVTSSLNPASSGQSVTLTATVTASDGSTPTGTANFIAGGTVLATGVALNGSGKATYTSSTLPAGVFSVTAYYAGNSSFDPSLSPALQQTVVGTSTTTTVSSSLNPSIYGNAVTLTATVIATGGATPTGAVNFIVNDIVFASDVPLNGSGKASYTTTTLPGGLPTITAFYRGQGVFDASLSAPFTQTVYEGLYLSTSQVNYQNVTDGTSVTLPVTLTNPNPVSVPITQIAATGTGFSQTNNCGTSLGGKATCTISVTFAPKSPGAANGTLSVTDAANASAVTAGLSGVGLAPP